MCGGSGGGKGGGGGGGGPDMTTPVSEMGLDQTAREIGKFNTAISVAQAKSDAAYNKGTSEGRRESREIGKEIRTLERRRSELKDSIERYKWEGREIIEKNGVKKDLGPAFDRGFRGHY